MCSCWETIRGGSTGCRFLDFTMSVLSEVCLYLLTGVGGVSCKCIVLIVWYGFAPIRYGHIALRVHVLQQGHDRLCVCAVLFTGRAGGAVGPTHAQGGCHLPGRAHGSSDPGGAMFFVAHMQVPHVVP